MRVHELAKELGVASKDLIVRIKELGHEVKNHMSLVDDEVAASLRTGQKPDQAAGSMFWFKRNRLSGSYFLLTSTRPR